MQTDKIKKIINNSFVSNHDLLQCIRNKSFKMSRDNSKELKPKVQMIKKKSFENISKQNSSFFANRVNNASCLLEPYQSTNEGTFDKVIYLIQDCLEELPEGMQKMRHKLKKSLEMLRSVREQKLKTEVNSKLFESQKENAMLKRIEQQYRQKITLQKQCDSLKEKIKILEKKNLKSSQKYISHTSRKHLERDDSNLHQIILSQSELINRQCQEHKEQNYEFRNILKTQALEIEKLLRNNHQPKYYFDQD